MKVLRSVNMEIIKEKTEEGILFHVNGEIDLFNVDLLNNSVKEELEQGNLHITMDLSQANYLDSSGIGVLISLKTIIKRLQGKFIIVNINQDIKNLFVMTNLADFFSIPKNEL